MQNIHTRLGLAFKLNSLIKSNRTQFSAINFDHFQTGLVTSKFCGSALGKQFPEHLLKLVLQKRSI